jgi:hypothetical protein
MHENGVQKRSFTVASMALMLACTSMVGQAIAAPAQTSQGIMVVLNADQSHALVENRQYAFNINTAATHFTNLWDGNPPTVTCTGSPANCANPAPPAPAAPVPDASKVTHPGTGVAVTNKCLFLDGGTPVGTTYTQTAQLTAGAGPTQRTYTYHYTYIVAPTGPVAAFTAWDLVNTSGGGTAQIALTAEIAGESVVYNPNNSRIGTKYSFSLRHPNGSSRVTDLVLTVNGVAHPVSSTIVENCPGCLAGALGAVDFDYVSNAGMYGVTSLLANGDARTILNTDSFAGNDNGGSDGRSLAKAVVDQVTVNLGIGEYHVLLTGIVKGNNASANIPFTVAGTVHVIAPGCRD